MSLGNFARSLLGTTLITTIGFYSPVLAATITNTGTDTDGVQLANGDSLINSGDISSSGNGVDGTTANSISNTGAISGASGFNGIYFHYDVRSIDNSGTITGAPLSGSMTTGAVMVNGQGHAFAPMDLFDNSGTISGDAGVMIIGGINSFSNSGSISASNDDFNAFIGTTPGAVGFGDYAPGQPNAAVWGQPTVSSFTNSGTILAPDAVGVFSAIPVTEFINTSNGNITSLLSATVLKMGTTSFLNAGIIRSTATTGSFGVQVEGTGGTVTNSGSIAGSVGVGFINLDFGATGNVVNSGVIEGTAGTAIQFGGGNDSLKILTGSSILGIVDFGGGTDTLDFSEFSGTAVLDVDGLTGENIVSGDNLFEWNGTNQIAIVEVAELAAVSTTTATTSVSIANEIGSVISDQLGDLGSGVTTSLAGGTVLGYAAGPQNTSAESAVLSVLDVGQQEQAEPSRQIWGTTFRGVSHDEAPTDLLNVFGGIVAGSHARFGDTTVGILGGVAKSALTVGLGTQDIDTLTGVLGAYGQYQAGVVSFDFSLLGGVNGHQSVRDSIVLGVTHAASASFSSWFVSPSVGLEIPVLQAGDGQLNIATSVSYVGGNVSGYTETGTGLNLTIGDAPIQVLEGRIELNGHTEISQTEFGALIASGKIGLMVQSNLGGSTIPVSFFEGAVQNVVTPATAAYGFFAGAAIAVPVSNSSSVQLGADVSARNDGLYAVSGNAKISATF